MTHIADTVRPPCATDDDHEHVYNVHDGWHCRWCSAILRLGKWYANPDHNDGLEGGDGRS